jgi:hypothetical protein
MGFVSMNLRQSYLAAQILLTVCAEFLSIPTTAPLGAGMKVAAFFSRSVSHGAQNFTSNNVQTMFCIHPDTFRHSLSLRSQPAFFQRAERSQPSQRKILGQMHVQSCDLGLFAVNPKQASQSIADLFFDSLFRVIRSWFE